MAGTAAGRRAKVKKGDQVVVMAGRDRGKRGRVLEVRPREGKVRVEGVAVVKRHQKANPAMNRGGGIIDKEALIDISNVQLIDPADGKIVDTGADELRAVTGQKPVTTRAKKSIASFKLRQGMPIGTMVTLRGDRMYEFFDRLVSIALPRVRDFRGVSPKAFDGRGNYTLGVRDQLIFPEIDFNKVDKTRGMNISIVTTARDDEQARALLRALGMPFRQ